MPKIASKKSKSSNSKETKENVNVPWYKDTSKILTLLSILAATTIGVLGIINNRAIARLGREVYVPMLQYYLGEYEPGKIFLDIENHGAATAQNVTISVSWKSKIELGNCNISSPFQDIEPVTPIVRRNLTFRIPNMVVGEKFQLICEIVVQIGNFEFSDYEGYETPIPQTIDATTRATQNAEATKNAQFLLLFRSLPTIEATRAAQLSTAFPPPTFVPGVPEPQINYDPYNFEQSTTIPPGFILLPSYIDKDFHIKTAVGYGDIEILITAENSKPAFETKPLPITIIAYLDPYSRRHNGISYLAFDISLSDILKMYYSMNETDFIQSCNKLKDKWANFENIKLDKFDASTYDVTLVPLDEKGLEVKVEGKNFMIAPYVTQGKDIVNIFGVISLCEKSEYIQIWLDPALMSMSNVVTP